MSHSPTDPADVLIVGGGSAGAVLASRLSQNPDRHVVLLEAGPAYTTAEYPAALLDADRIADPDHDWDYTSRGGARSVEIATPRGKVLGGSSSVNAGAALRPRPTDFARWAEHDLADWTFADVLPFFRALENTPTGEDAYHGRTGPMPVRQRADDELTPAQRAFIEACVARGHKRVHDFNGAEQNGAGGHAVNVVDGVRQNTALVHLPPQVRARPHLTVHGGVTVDRVLFRGTTATGVVTADGTTHLAREVILSAGAYGSAAILLRSGIGPTEDLTALGIDVLAALPVGRRLQDHPFFHTLYALAPEHLTMTPALGALLWTASSEAIGDTLDLHVVAAHPTEAPFSPTGGAFVLSAALVDPESHGTLRLAGRDPLHAPLIDHNYLGTDRDRRRMLEGVKLARDLARDAALAPLLGSLLIPNELPADDEGLLRAVESNLAVYGHPTSTVPMGGPGDPHAVVDTIGAVRGVDALRVVDASIIPRIPSTVTNLTTIMLAERISHRVYGD
ncbi:GMC family oxidoreductase [Streptomyces sp. NPDC008222]|uniref:GMC family oxidoreductase n=1 Tax=Streptomyces sp. NPDC008222 TaxID=3364820 RepID=UPI0036F0AF86